LSAGNKKPAYWRVSMARDVLLDELVKKPVSRLYEIVPHFFHRCQFFSVGVFIY
jgi:hypothetical protein